MACFFHRGDTSPAHRPPAPRAPRLLFVLLAACAAFAATVGSAQALVSGEFGFQQRTRLAAAPEKPLQYHQGAVTPASNVYAIYWDPVSAYRPEWMRLIDGYLHDMGADSGTLTNVFSLNSQYTGLAGSRAEYNATFRGAYTDTKPYPASECSHTASKAICLTDMQIREELKPFVYTNGLPYGLDAVYFVLTPPGVNVCTEDGSKNSCSDSTTTVSEEAKGEFTGFCSYHSAIDANTVGPILYATVPWTAGDAGHIESEFPLKTSGATPSVRACQNGATLVEPNQTGSRSPYGDYESGLADVIINNLSVQQSNVVTDPLLTGWYQTATNYEQGDMCQRLFNPEPEEPPKVPETSKAMPLSNETVNGHNYYLQRAFNSTGVTSGKGLTCWLGTELLPHFTAPNPVNASDIVAFDANESGLTLDANQLGISLLGETPAEEPFTVPVYTWNFGDGTPTVSGPAYASVFHSYQYGGAYAVTLTVTDSGGNVRSSTGTLTVNGPPAPGSGASGGPSTSGGAVSPTGSVPAPGTTTTGLAVPKVYDFVASHSLKKVLSYGLAVRYAVNEQVAGAMEVMLDSRTAKRLHIKGSAAKGLPKGYPRQVVLGGAVLVTTTAGHGTLRVHFSKQVVNRLSHVHKLKLTLRIIVRNADRAHPKRTTLLSTVVLK